MYPRRVEVGLLAMLGAFFFTMAIQWMASQYPNYFVGYFLIIFMTTVILQGASPDWLFDFIHTHLVTKRTQTTTDGVRDTSEDDYSQRITVDMAIYRMVNVVFSNWSIWLLCGAMEFFTLTILAVTGKFVIIVSILLVVTTTMLFFGRRFLLSDDFPRGALIILFGAYYLLCITPVGYNNALMGSALMTALRQIYYFYNCVLYFYLVPARSRTSRASSMAATTHLIYPLYGHWSVLVAGAIPTCIMSYMAARKIQPYVKHNLRVLNDKLERIRSNNDVFEFSHHEESALDMEAQSDEFGLEIPDTIFDDIEEAEL